MGICNREQEQIEGLIKELNLDQMVETVYHFSRLHRYTGYPQAEEAAQYLMEKLEEYGVPYERCEYDAFQSLPVSASLTVTKPEIMELPVLADVFSASAQELSGELCWVGREHWDRNHLSACKGKVLLTDMGGEGASEAGRYGAAAYIHTSISGANVIHHRTAGTVWGNPSLETMEEYPKIPVMSIGKEDGDKLVKLLEQGSVYIKYSVLMEWGVKKSTMPVAFVDGETDYYILISGHYDSWYEGVTDNATSNAVLLELARVFWLHRKELHRGVRFAWWSGHSDGRYAGSTWYCDHFWADLRKHCVAHINLDLCGCQSAKKVAARTTRMEGKRFTDDLILRFTGKCPETYLPMIRGADQSFWGVNIPISIMLKYEPEPKDRLSPCPGGGPWWHTAEDTLDKMEPEILLRDGKMNCLMAASLSIRQILPIDLPGFLIEMRNFLSDPEIQKPDALEVGSLREKLDHLSPLCARVQNYLQAGRASDAFIKETAGELVRITYTGRSRFEQDEAVSQRPFPGIRRAILAAGEEAEGRRLAAQTTFVRQYNRLDEALERIGSCMERQLREWEGRR